MKKYFVEAGRTGIYYIMKRRKSSQKEGGK
jgi:hypothetical protein